MSKPLIRKEKLVSFWDKAPGPWLRRQSILWIFSNIARTLQIFSNNESHRFYSAVGCTPCHVGLQILSYLFYTNLVCAPILWNESKWIFGLDFNPSQTRHSFYQQMETRVEHACAWNWALPSLWSIKRIMNWAKATEGLFERKHAASVIVITFLQRKQFIWHLW